VVNLETNYIQNMSKKTTLEYVGMIGTLYIRKNPIMFKIMNITDDGKSATIDFCDENGVSRAFIQQLLTRNVQGDWEGDWEAQGFPAHPNYGPNFYIAMDGGKSRPFKPSIY